MLNALDQLVLVNVFGAGQAAVGFYKVFVENNFPLHLEMTVMRALRVI